MNSLAPAPASIEQVVREFENGTIAPGEFSHESHIQVGWWYLQQYDLLEAITRFTAAIRHLTRKLGVVEKYHETITWFFLITIAERCQAAETQDWPSFKAANPDLFQWNPGLLQRYYSDERLQSGPARCMFVLPDLLR